MSSAQRITSGPSRPHESAAAATADARPETSAKDFDRIGAAGERELWWVAEAFEDESTKPEGMFTDREKALALAEELASKWDVKVVVSNLD